MAKQNYRASSPMVFKTVKDAETYWEEHLAGQKEDPDDDLALMESWLKGVIIEEVEDNFFSPSIAELQRDAMSRGHSNYPPGFDESLLD